MLGSLVDKDFLTRHSISFLQWKEEVLCFPVVCFTSEKDEAKLVIFALEKTWRALLSIRTNGSTEMRGLDRPEWRIV